LRTIAPSTWVAPDLAAPRPVIGLMHVTSQKSATPRATLGPDTTKSIRRLSQALTGRCVAKHPFNVPVGDVPSRLLKHLSPSGDQVLVVAVNAAGPSAGGSVVAVNVEHSPATPASHPRPKPRRRRKEQLNSSFDVFNAGVTGVEVHQSLEEGPAHERRRARHPHEIPETTSKPTSRQGSNTNSEPRCDNTNSSTASEQSSNNNSSKRNRN
jgi:hypothetical protein